MENETSKNEPKSNEDNNNYIYFILTHDKSKQFKISLPPEYKDGELQTVQEKDMTEIDNSLSTKIFKFKMILDFLTKEEGKEEYKVAILVEEDNGKQFKYNIIINDTKKNIFEFNFQIQEIGIIPLGYAQQFEIYRDYLIKIGIKQSSQVNEDFIISVSQIIGPNKQFDLSFYVLIFLECCNIAKLATKHLLLFKPDNLKGLGQISKEKLKIPKNILNMLFKTPEKFQFENENNKPKMIKLLLSLVFIFNLYYNHEVLPEMLEDEKLYDFLNNKLEKFIGAIGQIKIEKNIVIKLLQKAKNFKIFLIFLSFLGKDTIQFLEFINEQKEFFVNFIKEESNKIKKENENIQDKNKKKEIPIINIENFVEPKKEDDINKLYELINLIREFQSKDIKIIKFTPAFIDTYIDFYNEINLDNLFILKKIINIIIKKIDKNFESRRKINATIHENGIKLVQNGKLKNSKLLEFISNDEFYQNKRYNKKFYRNLEILDGIDISSLENDFFKKWKEINFCEIFDFDLSEFLRKISFNIKEMKDFELIFSFYDFYKDTEYKFEYIMNMQNRFMEIFDTYSADKCPNFNKDVIKLIYLSDKKKVNIYKFLKGFLQTSLDFEKVNEIYLQFIEEHQDFSKDMKEIIAEYFTKNKNNSNPSNLIFFIKTCKKLRNEIFSKINDFILNENEFFLIQDTENYQFFKVISKK